MVAIVAKSTRLDVTAVPIWCESSRGFLDSCWPSSWSSLNLGIPKEVQIPLCPRKKVDSFASESERKEARNKRLFFPYFFYVGCY